MRKMTKAFQLQPMTKTVRVVQYKDKWYPVTLYEVKESHTYFIYGKGSIKMSKKMLDSIKVIPNLPKEWKAQDILDVTNTFSLEVAEGLLHGWGSQSLFNDQSVGLIYTKRELLNMAYFGKVYDDFTDKIHELSQRFITYILLHKGYRFEGAWLWYKNELVGLTGLYESVWLSPLQHITHLLKGIVHVRPFFDALSFDKVLVQLISARPSGEAMLNRHVSVKDRIKFLTTQKIADDFEQIFTWQQVFNPKENENVRIQKES